MGYLRCMGWDDWVVWDVSDVCNDLSQSSQLVIH